MSSDAVTARLRGHRGSEISFETGRCQAGQRRVSSARATRWCSPPDRRQHPRRDFLPLTVTSRSGCSAGKIPPGSFFKREGRAGEKATLTAR